MKEFKQLHNSHPNILLNICCKFNLIPTELIYMSINVLFSTNLIIRFVLGILYTLKNI